MLRERLKELAKARRRFGYRRLHVFLRREGHEVNHKRLFRIYREEQLHAQIRSETRLACGPRSIKPGCPHSPGLATPQLALVMYILLRYTVYIN